MANTKITSRVIADNAVGISQLNVSDGTDGQVLKTNGSGTLSFGDASGGSGGAWTVISNSILTTAVESVEITLTGSYLKYVLDYSGVSFGTNGHFPNVYFTTPSGSYSENIRYARYGYGPQGEQVYAQASSAQPTLYPRGTTNSANGSFFGRYEIYNHEGMPTCHAVMSYCEDGGSGGVGFSLGSFGFTSPSSTDKFGKVRFGYSGSYNHDIGSRFTLYGIATS